MKDCQSFLDILFQYGVVEEAEVDKIENMDQRQRSRPSHSWPENNVVVINIQMIVNGMDLQWNFKNEVNSWKMFHFPQEFPYEKKDLESNANL